VAVGGGADVDGVVVGAVVEDESSPPEPSSSPELQAADPRATATSTERTASAFGHDLVRFIAGCLLGR
jgi:hypothetical protein